MVLCCFKLMLITKTVEWDWTKTFWSTMQTNPMDPVWLMKFVTQEETVPLIFTWPTPKNWLKSKLDLDCPSEKGSFDKCKWFYFVSAIGYHCAINFKIWYQFLVFTYDFPLQTFYSSKQHSRCNEMYMFVVQVYLVNLRLHCMFSQFTASFLPILYLLTNSKFWNKVGRWIHKRVQIRIHSALIGNLIKLKGTAKLTAQGERVCLKDSKYILFKILENRTWKGRTSSCRPSKPDLVIWLALPEGACTALSCPIF